MALSLSDPVFRDFAYYSTASLAKMFAVTFFTAYRRVTNGIFANPEDFPKSAASKKPVYDNALVERARRNHQNDLENIIPFVLVGGFYVLTKPDPATALWHFRAFFFSRVVHSLSYQLGTQPGRGLAFMIGVGTTFSMMYQVFKATS